MMDVMVLDPFQDSRYLEFISRAQGATIFHHPAWLAVLHQQYGFRPFVVATARGRAPLSSAIPLCEVHGLRSRRKWIALPFSDYCNLLYDDVNDMKAVVAYLIGQTRMNPRASLEIRGDLPFASELLGHSSAVLHLLTLTGGAEQTFAKFKQTQVQQPILKSQRENVIGAVSVSLDDLHGFYQLHLKTRQRLGVPVQPKTFFLRIFDHLISKGLGFLVVVRKDGMLAAAGLFGAFGNALTYKFGASDPAMLHFRPNNLMLWTAIQHGCTLGYSVFDFGKTDITNHGLRKFKAGWGSTETPLYFSYFPAVPTSGIAEKIQDYIVKPLIRSSPDFVCRGIGEIAYKYFA